MNYFEYFTEIETLFSRRRGSILFLSTLDWALIETWREAGIPLQAVLRGIEAAFDKHDAKAQRAGTRQRKVNGLAWCSQAVMQAAEELVEASTGLAPVTAAASAESGFEAERVAGFLSRNAEMLASAHLGGGAGVEAETMAATAVRLHELAAMMRSEAPLPLDELDRRLTVLEEKLLGAVQGAATEEEIVELRGQAERELMPYRARMSAVQLRQVQQQFLQKRLLEARGLPRLSLFYMGHDA